MSKFIVFTDGGARGNPGPAGIGIAIYGADGALVSTHKKFIGRATNNQAEYTGLIEALEQVLALGASDVVFNLDSELVVKQLNGQYKIKNAELAPLAGKALQLSRKIQRVSFVHVRREKNQVADGLVNDAIDAAI